ncbi:MAG: aminoacyl-tRNA hydrolase [Desulfotalea sp.]
MAAAELLLVGLGNPGNDYATTRHNIGFMFLDELVKIWNFPTLNEKYQSLFCKGRLSGKSLALLQPQTYMNKSGMAVGEYVRFYKINPENILVVHDDIDMAPGRIKLVRGGGAGGHNGIKSINSCVGFTDYYRLKIGVGRPGKHGVHPDIPVDRYVLQNFTNEQSQVLQERLSDIVSGLELFFDGSVSAATNLLNSLK